MVHTHMTTGGRYPVLRTVAILWMVAAVLSLIGGVYQSIVALTGNTSEQWIPVGGMNWSGRIMAFFIWLAATFFAVILNIAIAELIKLAIDVEHNSRMIAANGVVPSSTVTTSRLDNGKGGPDDESAEAALIRGH
jgi:hypothetical protein